MVFYLHPGDQVDLSNSLSPLGTHSVTQQTPLSRDGQMCPDLSDGGIEKAEIDAATLKSLCEQLKLSAKARQR